MFAVFRDLVRYNSEFAIGIVLTGGLVVIFACLSFVSPVDPSLIYSVPPDQPPSWQYLVRHELARPGHVLAAAALPSATR